MGIRRFTATALVLTLFVILCTPVMASEFTGNAADSPFVGILTLYSSTGSSSSFVGSGLGHAFLSFKNTSAVIQVVGVYSVSPQEEITFGKWGNTGNYGHIGVWYNLEAYLQNQKNAFAERVSMSIYITEAELDSISDMILDQDHKYSLYGDNCVDFAVDVWYETSSIYVLSTGYSETSVSYSLPRTLMNSMQTTGESQTGRSIAFNSKVGYYENGQFKQVDALTLTNIAIFLEADNEEMMNSGDSLD